MDINLELHKAIRQIESFFNAGRYKEAYENVNKLLLNFPDNGKLIKLKNQIEKNVYKNNIETVNKELNALKPLWKDKRYDELVIRLTEVVKYVPGYNKAEKQLYDAQNLYRKQIQIQQKDTLANYIRTIEKSINTGDFEKAISLSQEVLRKMPQHEKCGMLLAKAKNLLVDKKIKENQILLNSEKFEEIEGFLNELFKICPDSIRIKNLLNKAVNREKVTVEYAKKDFVFSAYEQIFLIYQKGKYDKTIEALRELLEVEPDNIKALELLKKAEKKFSSQLDREVAIKIKNLQNKFKTDKRKYPKNFIKL
jgi:tetratricopeptide (TPR) repeat protein